MGKINISSATTSERLWSRVTKLEGDDACWIWTGFTNKGGYGLIYIGGMWIDNSRKVELVHVVAYVLQGGSVEEDELVLHTCDNPPCVRWEHLYKGTKKNNAEDRDTRGRNGRAHLTPSQVVEIKMAKGLEPASQVALRYPVTSNTIRAIWRGKCWK